MQATINEYDPTDLSLSTIQQLFYKQINTLTRKTAELNDPIKTFDLQFSDAWMWGEKMTYKFKKTKHYDRQRIFNSIESDLMPEAFEAATPEFSIGDY